MSDDIDRTGYRGGQPSNELTALTNSIMAVMLEALGDEFRVSAQDILAQATYMVALDADPERPAGTIVRRIPAFREDERAPSGSYLQTMSGMVVWVLGVTPVDTVAVLHGKDTPDEHRADEPIESFLKRHVPYQRVPLLGGEE